MDLPVAEKILAVVGSLTRRAPSGAPYLRSLESVAELSRVSEEEMAADHLCNLVESFKVPLTREEYDGIVGVLQQLDMLDVLEDVNLLSLIF